MLVLSMLFFLVCMHSHICRNTYLSSNILSFSIHDPQYTHSALSIYNRCKSRCIKNTSLLYNIHCSLFNPIYSIFCINAKLTTCHDVSIAISKKNQFRVLLKLGGCHHLHGLIQVSERSMNRQNGWCLFTFTFANLPQLLLLWSECANVALPTRLNLERKRIV